MEAAQIKQKIQGKLWWPHWHIKGHPLLSLLRLSSLIWFKVKRQFKWDYSYWPPATSKETIDLFIPVIEKDAKMLEYCVEHARKYIEHPIGEIYLVAPKDSKILKSAASKLKVQFVAEEDVLPITKKDINYYANGQDRSGWIFKMLLNLASDLVCKNRYILVIDADTLFLAPQVFTYKQRPLFNLSDEYHTPYFDANRRLLGLKHYKSRSYITHYMLLDAEVLKKARTILEERYDGPWYESIINNIDTSQGSGFADYEFYGDFYHKYGRERPIYNYWSNVSLMYESFDELDKLIKKVQPYARSLSLHHYVKDKK